MQWELWKLNSSLLMDDNFCNGVKEAFQAECTGNGPSCIEKWEYFKDDVKLRAIERASVLKVQKTNEEKVLSQYLSNLLKNEQESPRSNHSAIKEIQAKLDSLHQERYRGAIIRARAEKFLLGEQPTSRALADERKYASEKEISVLEHRGFICDTKDTIEHAFVEHYEQLFGGHGLPTTMTDIRMLLREAPELSNEGKDWLEEPVTLIEVENAIDGLAANKTPGPDGLGAEFYQKFKKELSPFLLKVIHEAYDLKALPPSFLRSHTVLIPKSDDDSVRQRVTGYRPIALSNVDYKIFARILAKRLQHVICGLVGEHQTCGIRGRSIQTNIHVARTILESSSAERSPVAMLQIDLAKAFDKVYHDVLWEVLERANVGKIIIEGVKMAYKGCTTRLIINNSLSPIIKVLSFVRQGCPMSPLLFSLYLEPLCLSIIRSSQVQGFRMGEVETKVLAYADDIAVFCSNKESVTSVLEHCKYFCNATGASVNIDKCIGTWHGDWDTTPQYFKGVKWSTSPSKYLGAPLQYMRTNAEYWASVAEELRERATKWCGRDLSIFTRATVCNVFLVAKLWYVLQVMHCARTSIQKMHSVFAVFIRKSTVEPMRRDNLFLRVSKGGLGLSHLFVRQVVARFFFLRNQKHPFLQVMFQTRIAPHLPSLLVSSASGTPAYLVGFVKEVVHACEFLMVRYSRVYLFTVSRKKLTRDLIDSLFPAPLYRSLFTDMPGGDVLVRLKKMCIPPAAKSFFFRLHSDTLPVKVWLDGRGIFVPWGVNCLLCKQPETIEHVFINCWDAVMFWDVLKRTIKKKT